MGFVVIVLSILLFVLLLIPMFIAARNPVQDHDLSLDERMHLLQGRAYRNAFISTMVFALLLAFIDGMWCEYRQLPSFAVPAVFLYWVAAFGFSVFFADSRIKGIDIGKKGNEKTHFHFIWIWIAILLLPVIQFVEDGFFFHVSFPLRFSEGMVFGNMFVAVSMVTAHMIRNRIVKKEDAEDGE